MKRLFFMASLVMFISGATFANGGQKDCKNCKKKQCTEKTCTKCPKSTCNKS